jgi:hypothetical protein
MSNKTEKSVVLYRYFPKDIAYTVLFTEVVSINYKNLISILEQFSKEMESCFLGPVWRASLLKMEDLYSLGTEV